MGNGKWEGKTWTVDKGSAFAWHFQDVDLQRALLIAIKGIICVKLFIVVKT